MINLNRANFRPDLNQSRIITNYTEENFYKHQNSQMLNSQERTLVAYQINNNIGNDNGRDVTLYFDNDEEWIIDEKCSLHYDQAVRPLNSFTLEIFSRVTNNTRPLGWFLRNNLDTTHYLFMWVSSINHDQTYTIRQRDYTDYTNNINSLEIKLVNKFVLIQYLVEHYQLTSERLIEDANTLLLNNRRRKDYGDGLELIHSTEYPESPINLKVPKHIYSALAIIDMII